MGIAQRVLSAIACLSLKDYLHFSLVWVFLYMIQKPSEKYNWKIVLGTMVLSCIGYVVTAKVGYPIFLSGYAWAALAICVVVSVLLNRLESIAFVQWGKTAFILLGSISLEMYLYNIYLSEIVKMVFFELQY